MSSEEIDCSDGFDRCRLCRVTPRVRQADPENAPSSRQILDHDLARMKCNRPLRNGQAQAQAVSILVILLERSEQILRLLRPKTTALVLDFQDRLFVGSARPYSYRPAGTGVLDGVLNEIRYRGKQ